MDSESKRPQIEPGTHILIHASTGPSGRPIETRERVVGSCEDDLLWIEGNSQPLTIGDLVMVECPVPGDARYITPAEIEVQSPERFALGLYRDWRREQQRQFVRIATHGIDLHVLRPNADGSETPLRARSRHAISRAEQILPMLDLSAGGVRFGSHGDIEESERLILHFELPENARYRLPAEVVRTQAADTARIARGWAAACFLEVGEDHRSSLLRWVFAEQIRRHRAGRSG